MTQLVLFFFGSPRIELGGKPVDITRRKATALLAYLAITNQTHQRDTLATLLWPDFDQKRARGALRRILVTLNKALGKGWLKIDRETIGLQESSKIWIDINQFQKNLVSCPAQPHLPEDVCEACLPNLLTALTLYCNEFLAGFSVQSSADFDTWQLFQAERFRCKFVELLERLTTYYLQRHLFSEALDYAQEWARLNPFHELAHITLIKLHIWTNQYSLALKAYQNCIEVLQADLNLPPDEEMTRLYQIIKNRNSLPLPSPEAEVTPKPTNSLHHLLREAIKPPLPENLHNLVLPTTPFLGREQELKQIATCLQGDQCRLLTIVGPGGIGKTRLALQAAFEEIGHFKHGIYFISIESITAINTLIVKIANALKLTLSQPDDPQKELINYLHDKSILLVLDNLENFFEGGKLLQDILSNTLKIKILFTTRTRLNLQGEWVLPLHGLTYPLNNPLPPSFERYSAVQLFLQSANRIQFGFNPTAEEEKQIIRICQLLGGLPLGIELAAAWTEILSCTDIATEIEGNIGFLTTTWQDIPARHQSLHQLFEQSWGRLSATEQTIFSGLSVFKGDFKREAAESILHTSPAILLALINKSLLYYNQTTQRYHLHKSLYQYASQKLQENPAQKDLVEANYQAYYLKFVREQMPHLLGESQKKGLNAIEADIENIQKVWYLLLAQQDLEGIQPMIDPLFHFYGGRGWLKEGANIFRAGITALGGVPIYSHVQHHQLTQHDRLVGQLITRLAWCHFRLDVYEISQHLFEKSLTIARYFDDNQEVAFCLNYLGEVAYKLGYYAEAKRLLHEGFCVAVETNNQRRMARILDVLGNVATALGEYAGGKQLHYDSLLVKKNWVPNGISLSL